MPFRKFYKNNYKKKTFRRYGKKRSYKRVYKKKPRSKPSTMLLKSPTVIADRIRIKLKYNTYVSLAGTLGVPFSQIYQNSLNDPDLTGSGQQPLGFDQWSNFYSKYRVNGMAISIQGGNTNSNTPLLFSVYPALTSSLPSTPDAVFSQPYSKTVSVPQASGNSKVTIKNYMSTKKIYGYTNIDQEDDFTADYNANPVNLWYFIVYGYSSNSSIPTFQGIVRITYYVELFDRVSFNMS